MIHWTMRDELVIRDDRYRMSIRIEPGETAMDAARRLYIETQAEIAQRQKRVIRLQNFLNGNTDLDPKALDHDFHATL